MAAPKKIGIMEIWNHGKANIPKFHHSVPLSTTGFSQPPGGTTL
jgi:hypothetical protein